jgi:hypothetical protein
MADQSGRLDLSVGDIAEAGEIIVDYVAGSDITKGQAVKFSADNAVVPTTAAGEPAAGIAVKSAANGAMVPVLKKGKVKVTANGAIGIGLSVGTGASGKVLACATGTWGSTKLDELIGKNEGGAATQDGDLVLIRVNL